VNLEIENWSYGVAATVSTSGYSSPTLESVEVHDCFTGLWVLGASYLTATDSSFHDNVGNGISIGGAHGTPQPTFSRCQIEHNGSSGVGESAGRLLVQPLLRGLLHQLQRSPRLEQSVVLHDLGPKCGVPAHHDRLQRGKGDLRT
jgi:hypothetical protein